MITMPGIGDHDGRIPHSLLCVRMRARTATEWLDITQAADEFPFSRRTIWQWIGTGKLAAFKVARRKTLIRRRDLERLILASPRARQSSQRGAPEEPGGGAA